MTYSVSHINHHLRIHLNLCSDESIFQPLSKFKKKKKNSACTIAHMNEIILRSSSSSSSDNKHLNNSISIKTEKGLETYAEPRPSELPVSPTKKTTFYRRTYIVLQWYETICYARGNLPYFTLLLIALCLKCIKVILPVTSKYFTHDAWQEMLASLWNLVR